MLRDYYLCFALLCFALLCFALLCFAYVSSLYYFNAAIHSGNDYFYRRDVLEIKWIIRVFSKYLYRKNG